MQYDALNIVFFLSLEEIRVIAAYVSKSPAAISETPVCFL